MLSVAPRLRLPTYLGWLVIAFALIFSMSLNGAHAAESTPQAFLASIYKNYTGSDASGLRWRGNRTAQYFDPALTKLIQKDLKESKGEVGRIEFDPFVDAQDFEIENLEIKVLSQDTNAAKAVASFRNLGRPAEITYDLVKTPKGWRIANIAWKRPDSGDEDLRSILSRPL